MLVKALTRFPHGMTYVDKDADPFEMPAAQARVYIKVGLVEEYKEPKRKRIYRRRDVQPEQTAVMDSEDEISTE